MSVVVLIDSLLTLIPVPKNLPVSGHLISICIKNHPYLENLKPVKTDT